MVLMRFVRRNNMIGFVIWSLFWSVYNWIRNKKICFLRIPLDSGLIPKQ